MRNQIKMVAFDLDGTILNSNKVFTAYTQAVLSKVMQKGIIVLPVTGRPQSGIPKDIAQMPGIRYAVTANGARIIDYVEDSVLYEDLLPAEKGRKILDIFEHYDTLREVYYNGIGFTEKDMLHHIEEFLPNRPMAEYVRATRRTVDNVRELFEREQKSLDKMQALFKTSADKEAALLELKSVTEVEITGALSNNIEVNAHGVHKGNALIWLGKTLGIDKEEMMAFGDGGNDLEMIKAVGYGVCMSNGLEAVKDVAQVIAPSNDEDGVAKVLEQRILV